MDTAIVNRNQFDVLIIGKGLIGSAALRWLIQSGVNAAIIGPDEPKEDNDDNVVFGAHYDEARITSQMDSGPVWSELAQAAIARYRELEEASGIRFYDERGGLYAVDREKGDFFQKLQRSIDKQDVKCSLLSGTELKGKLPYFQFPSDTQIFWQAQDAGCINPRRLIQAQLAVARRTGAAIFPETVRKLAPSANGFEISTFESGRYFAEKVLLAAGAFSNCFDLLPQKLALTLKSESVIFGKVSETQANSLSGMPPLLYENDDDFIFDIYLLPPVLYPDGNWYLKLGSNSPLDRELSTLDEISGWYAAGNSDEALPKLRAAMESILPGVEFKSWHTQRCAITRTKPSIADYPLPYIDTPFTDTPGWENFYVAVGGNGRAAKSADELGRLAANLVLGGEIDSPISIDPAPVGPNKLAEHKSNLFCAVIAT